METVQAALWVVILLVALALIFDFMNGFHDAANSIATVVSTGVLKPGQAVVFAAFFNFIAIFVFHLSVAATIGKGTVDAHVVDHYVIFGALVGAIAWNVLTWYYGIPSSSSHALVGGLIGAAIVKAGPALVATCMAVEEQYANGPECLIVPGDDGQVDLHQLLIELANRGVNEVLVEAGATRFRPIVMTTLAMIFGMVPLAFALSEGAEMRAPMGQAVIGGVITSSLLTLVVVPVVYCYMDDLAAWALCLWRKAPAPGR